MVTYLSAIMSIVCDYKQKDLSRPFKAPWYHSSPFHFSIISIVKTSEHCLRLGKNFPQNPVYSTGSGRVPYRFLPYVHLNTSILLKIIQQWNPFWYDFLLSFSVCFELKHWPTVLTRSLMDRQCWKCSKDT